MGAALGIALVFAWYGVPESEHTECAHAVARPALPDRDELRQLRREVALQLRGANPPSPQGAAAAARRLLALYDRVDGASFADAERNRLKRQLAARLEAHARVIEQHARRAAAKERGGRNERAGGGALAANARELIDLIQSTIAPESWDVAGGRGTIRYYSRNPALVIRQTAEVHEQIGGALRQARR
jgi:hypothetical protein